MLQLTLCILGGFVVIVSTVGITYLCVRHFHAKRVNLRAAEVEKVVESAKERIDVKESALIERQRKAE